MADTITQGVNYEISATDKTGPELDSALQNVDRAAEQAKKRSQEVAERFKGEFNPVTALTAALGGNFQALGTQLLGLVSKLKGVHMSMMQFGLYAAAIMAVVKLVRELGEAFGQARERVEKIKLDNAAASLNTLKKEAAVFADHIARSAKNAEDLANNLRQQLSALEALTKAQNEYAKAQELALARSDEERKSIERKYREIDTVNGQEVAAKRREVERAAAVEKIRAAEEEIAQYRDQEKDALSQANELSKRASGILKKDNERGFFSLLGSAISWRLGFGKENAAQVKRSGELFSSSSSFRDEAIEAAKKRQEAEDRLKKLKEELSVLDTRQEAEVYTEAAASQNLLNDRWKEYDDDRRQAEEEYKEEAKAAAEEVKEARIAAEAEVKRHRQADIADLAKEEAAAQTRLAAARNAVQQAWGWYRDKGAMQRQLDEEKANAEAEKQFEKDFDRLRGRRDWREAKNLSVDQEAVRRVALAREEENAAQKAVVSIDQKMTEAVAELRKITEET